jgi:hypothetical protein
MKSTIQPIPLLFFLSVIALIGAYWIYGLAGTVAFLTATAAFGIVVGAVIGAGWRMYPWQIGLLGAVPGSLFLAWRFYTAGTQTEAVENVSLFVFHPLLVLATCYFGGLMGRWRALKRKTGP